MATVTLWGATYQDVPAVELPSGSGVVIFYEGVDGDNLGYGSLTDLTGTRWHFNDSLNITINGDFALTFSSGTDNWTTLSANSSSAELHYIYSAGGQQTTRFVYGYTRWHELTAQDITITGGSAATNTTLIAWFLANATQQ